jgi:hypothetical protein
MSVRCAVCDRVSTHAEHGHHQELVPRRQDGQLGWFFIDARGTAVEHRATGPTQVALFVSGQDEYACSWDCFLDLVRRRR